LEKQFFKTFSAENSIFFQHFWGKIFREIFRGIFRGIFPGKNVRKIGPWSHCRDANSDPSPFLHAEPPLPLGLASFGLFKRGASFKTVTTL
jgi:hypothetical protein